MEEVVELVRFYVGEKVYLCLCIWIESVYWFVSCKEIDFFGVC